MFMTKQEFLEELRVSLNGRLAPRLIEENMRFYEDYINMEIRKGKSEEEVFAALGDPRLIARTIVETKGGSGEWSAEYAGGDTAGSAGRNEGRTEKKSSNAQWRIPLWMWAIIALLIVVVVLSAVFSVISAILPVILPILLVILLVKVFRDWVN